MSVAVLGVGGTIAAGTAVVGAGASIYGASQAGGSGGGAPPMLTPKKSLLSYLKGLDAGLPDLYDMESEYRPQFGGLNLADQGQYLTGLLGLGGQANSAASQQLQAARQAEFGNMAGNSSAVMSLLGGVNPYGKQAMERTASMADTAYQRAIGPLSFEDKRTADQTAREGMQARGRVNDNVGIFAEMLGRDDMKEKRRNEALNMMNQSFATSQQYSSPALSLLGGVPASVAFGQDYLGQSAGAIGKNGPQFINPDAGMNMGMAQNQNLASWSAAQATQQAGQNAMWGQLGSSLMGIGANYFKPTT
ncbi:hypothetical protein [Luteolibacter sp. Populi]|uniref:hypothetical protein n=1 Tax=Luteolibacter sp. Populi TaxID=3230487 RepID=UPI0034678A82